MPSARKTSPCRRRRKRCGPHCKNPAARCRTRRDAKKFKKLRRATMYSFTFERPQTLRQAVNLLSKNADAKLLAGGHTLLPTMKLRLPQPAGVVHLSRHAGL